MQQINCPSLADQFPRRCFTRRSDLTAEKRLAIASSALHATTHRVWGKITELAEEYQVSRPFVYSLAATLKEAGRFLFEQATDTLSHRSSRWLARQFML